LDAEGDEEGEVAVLGGERGDNNAGAETESGHQENKRRGEDWDPEPIGRDGRAGGEVVKEKAKEEPELNAELDDVRNDDGKWHHQPGKVHLSEDTRVGDEGVGGFVEAIGKIVPRRGARQIEKHRRVTVRRDLGNATEDDGEDKGRKQRLDEKPDGTQDRLFVNRDEIAADKEPEQIAVAPDIGKMEIK